MVLVSLIVNVLVGSSFLVDVVYVRMVFFMCVCVVFGRWLVAWCYRIYVIINIGCGFGNVCESFGVVKPEAS